MFAETREQAFFGGWKVREVDAGDHQWGPPQDRVQEFVPSEAGVVVYLPPHGAWLPLGVPYHLINSGADDITVKRPSDDANVVSLPAGESVTVLPSVGGTWVAISNGASAFGPPWPDLRFEVEITTLASDFNLFATLQNKHGYDGVTPAAAICRVRPGAAVGATSKDVRAWSTGPAASWPATSRAVLIVYQDGAIGGWGGRGGRGGVPGTVTPGGEPGEDGGQAIRNEIPLAILVHDGGIVFGGGGGGGGGDSSTTDSTIIGGGGGGGRGINFGGAILQSAGGVTVPPAQPGTPGGPSVFGAGGLGSNTGGNAGNGGGAATVGSAGNAVGNSSNSSTGLGGAAGAAISYLPAAGAPTILGGGANIAGSTVSEAS